MSRGSVSSLSSELLGAPDVALSEEEAAAVEARKSELDKLLEREQLAKYKLEVMFSHRHTMRAPTPGTVTWWESGTKLHGGGDAKLYLCDNSVPRDYNGRNLEGAGCRQFIPESAHGLSRIVCPNCMRMWAPEHLVGEIFYRLPIEKWADVLLDWYQRLEMRADIRIKYARMSIKGAQEREAEKKLQGDLLNKARSFEQRSVYIYPLKNIIKDTSAGADLRGRILAFLKA
jgi:hypothetical protein